MTSEDYGESKLGFFWLCVSYIYSVIDTPFREHPLLTNTLTSGCLLLFGDLIIQYMEHWYGMNQHSTAARRSRSYRVWIVGCVIGAFSHVWYGILERLVVSEGMMSVLKKILWDQAIAGPFFSSVFLVGMGLLEMRGLRDIGEEWSRKFLDIYKNDWKVWPLAQFINFSFVPLRYRVLYVNFITLCWDMYLSYVKHMVE